MVKIWSELPGARLKEQLADGATILWLLFWGSLVWQLFQLLSGFAQAGRTIRDGGEAMIRSGADLGESLAGIPLVGSGIRDVVRDSFGGAGRPLSAFGSELAQFILVISAVLALLLALVSIGPWLNRYLPWRLARLRRVRAAHRVIRSAHNLADANVEGALALRAVARLEYSELLQFTPDPFGDWAGGRLDRLARAELASVGLGPRALKSMPQTGITREG
ncbi:MAG: hypothetical protein ABIV26_00575 [Candidatus Limnocylindrales bacterium]